MGYGSRLALSSCSLWRPHPAPVGTWAVSLHGNWGGGPPVGRPPLACCIAGVSWVSLPGGAGVGRGGGPLCCSPPGCAQGGPQMLRQALPSRGPPLLGCSSLPSTACVCGQNSTGRWARTASSTALGAPSSFASPPQCGDSTEGEGLWPEPERPWGRDSVGGLVRGGAPESGSLLWCFQERKDQHH